MPMPFDASVRTAMRRRPADWVRLALVRVNGRVRSLEGDASIVSANRDSLFLIEALVRFLANLEILSKWDPEFLDRLLRYNVIATAQEGLPVVSVAILLRPEADHPSLTGELRRATPDGEYLVFKYRVVRVWEIPVEEILAGGVGIVALAPLAKGAEKRLPAVLREVERRLVEELPASQVADMLAVTGVLMGLRYPPDVCQTFLRGVKNMKDSVVYQMILEEGKKEGREEGREEGERTGRQAGVDEGIATLQRMLLKLGGERFGAPTKAAQRKIHAIHSLERLQELGEHLLRCRSWKDFLAQNE